MTSRDGVCHVTSPGPTFVSRNGAPRSRTGRAGLHRDVLRMASPQLGLERVAELADNNCAAASVQKKLPLRDPDLC